MTKHNVASLILSVDELNHFTEMVNVCLAGTSRAYKTDPSVLDAGITPLLEELEEHLNFIIPATVTRAELKQVISAWIDQKIGQPQSLPAPG